MVSGLMYVLQVPVNLFFRSKQFLIDLTKHRSGINYIHIKQTIEGNNNGQELKINPSIATYLISVLQYYQK